MIFQKKHKIGDTIAKLRKEKGWTQNELAEKLQVSDKAISKWESNKGDPSIEFLPVMAELFGVTLDYLMTGKEQEEKILTISKLELCAKKDDIKIFDEIYNSNKNLNITDEKGKNLLDYIFKYDSVKVFTHILELNCQSYLLKNGFHWNDIDLDKLLRLMIISNNIDKMKLVELNELKYINEKELTPIVMDTIVNDERVSKETIKYIFSFHTNDTINPKTNWQIVYPLLLERAVESKNDKMIRYIWNIIDTINKDVINQKENALSNTINTCERENITISINPHPRTVGFNYTTIYNYSCASITKKTIKMAIDNNELEMAYKFNENNKLVGGYVADEYDFEKQRILSNKTLSNQEKKLKLCIHNGIVSIDELIALNDFDLYKKTINKYPISECESIYNDLKKKNYKTLFQLANQNDIHYLINDIQKKEEYQLESDFAFYVFDKGNKDEINKRYLDKYINKTEYTKIGLLPPHYPFKLRKVTSFPAEIFDLSKNYIFLLEVLDKDIKFIEKACKTANQQELDDALTKVAPNNFKAINILLNFGAKLHKTWTEDDGWGYMVNRDEIDEIGTEILKKKIKDVLGEK